MNNGSKKSMFVTPNPVTDTISLHITSDIAALSDIRVVDVIGKILYKGISKLTKGENIIYVNDLTYAAPGTYLVQAIIDGEVLVQKIVISK